MSIATILIANRGEIAVRVIRACRELGIRTVAVYSEADRFAQHARLADLVLPIGPAPARASYLNSDAIIAAAQASGADAIHPGYGFLSENAAFAEACAAAGIIFIGPPPSAIRLMGSKTAAKAAVMAGDVPTVPGYLGTAPGEKQDDATMLREAKRIGFPVMIKAAAGGGGKGMRVVHSAATFADDLAAARREAQAAFGDATVFLEKLIVQPRHVEFQILADAHGACLHLGERECSIQRRHQKIVEESPSVALTPESRARMGQAAVRAAQAGGYVNAGTVEFLLDTDGQFYFLEMNTRLQVEHPVTEQVTGFDLVHLQIAIAEGQPLALRQEQIGPRGHAIEVRLYAEDPVTYLPAMGTLLAFEPPRGPGIRLDGGVATGDEVSVHYDPMLAKLIVTAPDRPTAIARMRMALAEFVVLGVTTNLPLLRQILADERFAGGATSTAFLDDPAYSSDRPMPAPDDMTPAGRAGEAGQILSMPLLLVAAALRERATAGASAAAQRSPWAPGALRASSFTARYLVAGHSHAVELRDDPSIRGSFHALVDGEPITIDPQRAGEALSAHLAPEGAHIILRQGTHQAQLWAVMRPDGALLATDGSHEVLATHPHPPDVDDITHGAEAAGGTGAITAPMAGTIIQVRVRPGDQVEARQTLIVLGAMKMEHNLIAPGPARVRRVAVREGDVVTGGAVLVEFET